MTTPFESTLIAQIEEEVKESLFQFAKIKDEKVRLSVLISYNQLLEGYYDDVTEALYQNALTANEHYAKK